MVDHKRDNKHQKPFDESISSLLIQHPPVKKFAFSSAFLPYKVATAKYNKQPSKVVIKSTDIMALNIAMVTRTLDLVWTFCIVFHMLLARYHKKVIQSLLTL